MAMTRAKTYQRTIESLDWLEEVVPGRRRVGVRKALYVDGWEVLGLVVGVVEGLHETVLEGTQDVAPRLVGSVHEAAIEEGADLIQLVQENKTIRNDDMLVRLSLPVY